MYIQPHITKLRYRGIIPVLVASGVIYAINGTNIIKALRIRRYSTQIRKIIVEYIYPNEPPYQKLTYIAKPPFYNSSICFVYRSVF